jgi:hypothetical protein
MYFLLLPLCELKHDLVLPDQAQLVPRDSLHRRWVTPQLVHLRPEAGDVAPELGVLRVHAIELLRHLPHTRQPFRLEDEDGGANDREREDGNRERALDGRGQMHRKEGTIARGALDGQFLRAGFAM